MVWYENQSADCNGNDVPDVCEIDSGAGDCNADGVLDECEPDRNRNGASDRCEPDCNGNGVLDDLESDCNGSACDADGDGCLDEFDSEAFLEGAVVDLLADPPFGPFSIVGPTTAESKILNPLPQAVPFMSGLGMILLLAVFLLGLAVVVVSRLPAFRKT